MKVFSLLTRRNAGFIVTCLAVTLSSSMASAASMKEAQATQIAKDLRSTDAATVDAAAALVRECFRTDPLHAAPYFKRFWVSSLLDAKKFDLAAELSWPATLIMSSSASEMNTLLTLRANALLKANQPKEALVAARGAFNVAPMTSTAKALLLIDQCLQAVGGADSEKLSAQFKREQLDGAQPTTESPKTSPTLLAIPLMADQIDEQIKNLNPNLATYNLSRGNLLLLQGKTKEASEAFRDYMLEKNSNMVALHENMARAIRDEDGTIGRANGYLLSLTDKQLAPVPIDAQIP